MNKYDFINSKRRFLITAGLFSMGAILPILTNSGGEAHVIAKGEPSVSINPGKNVATLINIIKVEL
jgi:hypothetical protein